MTDATQRHPRTPLEWAKHVRRYDLTPGVANPLAEALEQQAAQIAEKDHQLRAAKTIIAGFEERALHQAREYALLKSHSSDIAGEREANALLTSEVEALRADAERLMAVTEETANMLRGMCMDPTLRKDVAEALWSRVRKLDKSAEDAARAAMQPSGEVK